MSSFSIGDRPVPEPDEWSKPFFDATLRGELLLQHCGACGRWMWPVKTHCIDCLADDLRWEAASGLGTLYSFTLVHQLVHPGFKGETPYNLAQVDLDEGVRINTSIVGVENEELRIGLRLSAVFVLASDHIAVPMFQPHQAASRT
jgi:uncharacterized OB-fold protein